MKNPGLKALATVLSASVILAGCNGLGKMAKKANTVTYEVKPNPMEMHGDSISVTVSGKYPPKYFAKKAVVTVTPTIKYSGGETAMKAVTIVGEKAEGNGTKVAYKAGGSFSHTAKVAYQPGMEKAELMLKATGQVKSKTKDFPEMKIADGTIITPLLVRSDDKVLIGKDNFQRITPVSNTANIYYVVNQSVVRPTEMNSDEMKTMKEFISMGVKKGNYNFKNMNVSAYASPDGEQSLNADLANDRAKSGSKAMQGVFGDKKNKVDAGTKPEFYNTVTTAEDWEGFKKLMEASNIADKDLILRVLTMYTDLDQREKEIKNLSKTYVEVAENILPKLRRSVLTLNAEVVGRSDEQITKLAMSNSDSLSVEEILYAATLTNDWNTKLDIYKKAEKQYPSDWRTVNNVGYVYLMQNKLADAEAQFKKADGISQNNPIIQNNLGVVARWKGDRKAAMNYYKSATSAGPEVSYNIGILNILDGDYSSAVSNFGGNKSFNTALAQLLNGNPDAAMSTLDSSPEKDAAHSYYLKAIIGARQGKTDVMTNNLKAAIQKDASYRQKAQDDAEFIKYRENGDFKSAIQ
jgi:tetratricopeptide (TPR) repeat protein